MSLEKCQHATKKRQSGLQEERRNRELLYAHCFPGIVDPHITDCLCGEVLALFDHLLGQCTLLGLVLILQAKAHSQISNLLSSLQVVRSSSCTTHMQHENAKRSLLRRSSQNLCRLLDILLQLTNSIFESSTCVIDLVDDQHALANQIGHLEAAKVEPLRTRHSGTNLFLVDACS